MDSTAPERIWVARWGVNGDGYENPIRPDMQKCLEDDTEYVRADLATAAQAQARAEGVALGLERAAGIAKAAASDDPFASIAPNPEQIAATENEARAAPPSPRPS